MNNLLIIITIGIALSMDAFSVSMSIAASNKTNKNYFFVLIVGIYHFIMPLLGNYTSNTLINNIFLNSNLIVGFILILIGINTLIGMKNKEDNIIINLASYITLGLGVSLDSFGTGIGISLINHNMLLNSIIFSLCSMLFTFVGLKIGERINEIFGRLANIFGCLILLTLGIYYLLM